MPTFNVELSRRFVQTETATIAVEARNATDARKLARAKMSEPDSGGIDWDASDSWYEHYTVEEVAAA
jgi:hypothetical protein